MCSWSWEVLTHKISAQLVAWHRRLSLICLLFLQPQLSIIPAQPVCSGDTILLATGCCSHLLAWCGLLCLVCFSILTPLFLPADPPTWTLGSDITSSSRCPVMEGTWYLGIPLWLPLGWVLRTESQSWLPQEIVGSLTQAPCLFTSETPMSSTVLDTPTGLPVGQ